MLSDEIPFFKAARKHEEKYSKYEKENFTSLKNELWWFVRNCSEENFHEPLETTDELTEELLKIIEKWNNNNKLI
jgi:hypothetical protein